MGYSEEFGAVFVLFFKSFFFFNSLLIDYWVLQKRKDEVFMEEFPLPFVKRFKMELKVLIDSSDCLCSLRFPVVKIAMLIRPSVFTLYKEKI